MYDSNFTAEKNKLAKNMFSHFLLETAHDGVPRSLLKQLSSSRGPQAGCRWSPGQRALVLTRYTGRRVYIVQNTLPLAPGKKRKIKEQGKMKKRGGKKGKNSLILGSKRGKMP